jgi:4,4'-diaponeurosporenoate glycosyltransferase
VLRLGLEALRLSLGFLLLCRWPRPAPAPPGEGPLALAVIVPARDEADALPGLLASLGTQRRPAAEVVVVDDGSGDATAEVAAAGGARVLAAPPRPPGWNGKQWACHVGAAATTAPVLCFVDADVELASDALERLAAEVAARGGLISVQPWHRTGSAVEGLSLFPNLVSMMAVDAFGPVLAARRADHERAGGHEAVRGAAMEDVALARSYRRAGLPVTVEAGRGTASFRMYRGGLRSIVEGWTKGLGDGVRRVRPLTLLAVAAWLSGAASAPADILVRPGLGTALWVAYAAQLGLLGRRAGRFPAWSWLAYPVALAFFFAVFLRSVLAALMGWGVTWKGRRLEM